MKRKILPYVLQNMIEFGNVNPKAVLGQVLKGNPDLKNDVTDVLKEISQIIEEIKDLTPDQLKEKLPANFLQEKKEEIKGPLKSLPKAEIGKVVVRIAPSPSGPLHIGHAYGASLNYAYAKMYEGKFIVRIEDTNPENIYPEAYKLIPADAQWLTDNSVSEVIVQSSRLGIYYDYAEKLINQGKAYVCTCIADTWRLQKNKSEPCGCRSLVVKENQEKYAKMFSSYAEGEAVLRLKTDIKHKNPAMRDFGLMRINEHVHPQTGKEQRVWPLMVFSVAIDDQLLGVTHVLNGKDHTDNAKKEALIMQLLGWEPPEYKHWGMINFTGFALSSSKTRLAVEHNEYAGWDDIRLPFLPALRKRGYQPEAFEKFAIEIGLSLNDKSVTMEEFWKMINSFNKEIIEGKAKRFFFVDNPVKIKISNLPLKKVMMNLHPEHPELGKRELQVTEEIQIAKTDFVGLVTGKIHRLIDFCNFKLNGDNWEYISDNYEEYKNSPNKGDIIHWLPTEKNVKVEVLQENGDMITGNGEQAIECLKVGDIVQFERRYFASLVKRDGHKFTFWYLHK